MKRDHSSIIESLESRTLFSGTLAASNDVPVPALHATASAVATVPAVTGPTLKLTAGVAFAGVVGFYASPVLDPPGAYAATIAWGDGATSNATLTYGANGSQFGYKISGAHHYAKPGIFNVKITLVIGPYTPKLAFPTRLIEYIADKAIVHSHNGVILNESAGKSFTAILGTFTDIAPATNLTATISWGDGKISTGVITATGIQGVDVIKFKVTGAHTYRLGGIYPIHVVITRAALNPASPTPGVYVVATIDSDAIVTTPVVAKPAPI